MSNKKVLLTALTMAAAFAVAVPLIARTENIGTSVPESLSRPDSSLAPGPKETSTDDEPQVVSLQVTPSGFEPNETIVFRGKFLILVQNRTGNRELSFYLIRENQERLAESDPQKRDWKAYVQLGPGTYIVGETSHPEWQSIIRVTN
jgi:hypothetical protein